MHDALPPPGWYDDPAGPGLLRWWDGARWSGSVAPLPPPPTAAPWGPQPTIPDPAQPVPSAALRQPGPAAGQPAWQWAPAYAGPSAPAALAAAERVIPARAVWWALLGLLVGEVVGGVLATIVSTVSGSSSGAGTTLAGEVGLWAGMGGAALFVSRRYGTGSLAADFGLRFRRVDLGWGLLVAVCGFAIEVVLGAFFAGTRLAGSNTQLITGQKGHTGGFVTITLIVSIGAPLFEELFFRGVVRTALRSAVGPGWAAVLSGAIFGLAHATPSNGLGNVEVIVVIGAFGVVLALFANLTGRLAAGMVGHALFNVVATLSVLAG